MFKIDSIIQGWSNFIDKSDVTEDLAKQRAMACSPCPSAKRGKLLAFIKDDLKQVEGIYCKECQCPLSAKIRSQKETCPLNRWNE